MLRRKRALGFTLLELLIVVIIIGILATIAVPGFVRFTRRARAADGQNMVGAIMTGLQVYYLERARYTNVTTELDMTIPTSDTFIFTITSGASPAVVQARGRSGTGAEGLTVIGTLQSSGARSITVLGL